MLELADVHTYYGNIRALRGLSLSVQRGEIVTLIGANGAGKTTTLRTILGTVAAPARHRDLQRPDDQHPGHRSHRAPGHRAVAGRPAHLSRA